MEIYRIVIPKEKLRSLPKSELIFFVMIGTMLNEINMLHKLTILSKVDHENEIHRKAAQSQSLFMQSLLCGKLCECWLFLKKVYFNMLSKDFEEYLPENAKEDLKAIKKYFSKDDCFLNRVRNKIAFHYDSDKIGTHLDDILIEDDCEIYLSESQGNSLFYFSTGVLLRSILEMAGGLEDPKASLDRFFSDLIAMAGHFLNFLNHTLVVIAEKHGWEDSIIKDKVDLTDVPEISEIVFPYFIRRQ